MDFHGYIHAVGTGQKGNRNLGFEESADMMRQLLERTPYDEQIAAFLLGWRIKPETTEEFRGILHTCDSYISPTTIENSIELGYPFDGKVNNPYIFPLAAKIAKPHLDIVLVGDELQPAKGGITVKEVVSNTDLSANIHFFDRKEYFEKLHDLTGLRMRLGLRTGLNTIEKLPRIANSQYAVTGVFHKPYVQKYIDIFADRYKRFAILQGNEGTPELFSKGRLWISDEKGVEEIVIDPKYYGIGYKRSWERITLEESLLQLADPSDGFLKLAVLNAAIMLFIMQKTDSIDEAFELLDRQEI